MKTVITEFKCLNLIEGLQCHLLRLHDSQALQDVEGEQGRSTPERQQEHEEEKINGAFRCYPQTLCHHGINLVTFCCFVTTLAADLGNPAF